MNYRAVVIGFLIVLMFASSVLVYSNVPDLMVTHWSVKNSPNGYMPKFWGLFLMPLISVLLVGVFCLIPKIDPLKKNIKKFTKYYEFFIIVVLGFLFYTHLITVSWNIGFEVDIGQALSPGFAMLFYALGVFMKRAEQNWFIGIRTPWTLSNKTVWRKTHDAGSVFFKIAGVIAIFGVVFPNAMLILILVPILVFTAYLFLFSYLEFKKLDGNNRRRKKVKKPKKRKKS